MDLEIDRSETELKDKTLEDTKIHIKQEIKDEIDLYSENSINNDSEDDTFMKTEYESDQDDIPDLVKIEVCEEFVKHEVTLDKDDGTLNSLINRKHNDVESGKETEDEKFQHSMNYGHSSGQKQCHLCKKVFASDQYLKIHIRKKICCTEDVKQNKSMKLEDLFITDETDIKVSIKRKKFKCTLCKKVLTGITSIQRHLLIHTGEKKYTCHTCNRSFGLKSSLKKHQVTHRQKEYKCHICDKILTSKNFLKNHMEQHTNEGKYVCHICDCNFGLESSLKRHQVIHKEKQDQCSICQKFFSSEKFLQIHMQQHNDKNRYSCDMCDSSFGIESSLKRHQISHRQKQYKCDYCDKFFMTEKYLGNHLHEHSTEPKKYHCDKCNASFGVESNLRRHRVKHKIEFRKFSCEFCTRVFNNVDSLNGHQQVHRTAIDAKEKIDLASLKTEYENLDENRQEQC